MGGACAKALVQLNYRVSCFGRHDIKTPRDDLLSDADVVVSLLPSTSESLKFFDAGRFSKFRPGSSFVNLSRGSVVCEEALLDCLDKGHLNLAVLDVFATEPLPHDHRFWTHDRVVVLPHVAAKSDPASCVSIAASNIKQWEETQTVGLGKVDRNLGY